MLKDELISRTSVTFLGRRLKSPLFVAAGPNTQTVERCLEALENGAGAVEISFIRGNNNIFDDHTRADIYTVIPKKKDAYNGNFYGLVSTGMHVKKDKPEVFIEKTMQKVQKVKSLSGTSSIVVSNIGAVGYKGDGIYTWGQMASMAQHAGADALTLHLQTGNLMAGGIFSKDPDFLGRIVADVRAHSSLPIIAKLPIEGCEPSMLADIADDLGVDAVASTGRFIGLLPNIDTLECTLGGHIGYGGSWVLPNTCAWAARMYCDRPNRSLVPGGGISSWEDIVKVILCGGTMVQVCTWPMLNGYEVLGKALLQIEQWMDRKGYKSLTELRGVIAEKATKSAELWARTPERTGTPHYNIRINEQLCKRCDKCLPNCFFNAITVKNGTYAIDPDKCMGCGCCMGTCPFDAIS